MNESQDAAIRRLAFAALCRLDHREADYTGDWWTTRPDTSGPYYKPVAWELTGKIEAALAATLHRVDSHAASELLVDLIRNKVELEGAAALDIDFAGLEPPARGAIVDMLAARPSLPDRSSQFLESVAASDAEVPALRARALRGLVRHHQRTPDRLLAAIGQNEASPPVLLDVWRDYVRDNRHARNVGKFRKLAENDDAAAQRARICRAARRGR